MKYRTTAILNLRSEPNTTSLILCQIPAGTLIDGEACAMPTWRAVTSLDGKKGFCAASYLEIVQDLDKSIGWSTPVPKPYFKLSQTYLNEDWSLYPRFGHHTGVDYGGRGQLGIPLMACADGEIVYREVANSAWGASLGNHAALYVPSVDRSFLYCHMSAEPHPLGPVKAGEQIGVMGNTGKSAANAIHLHLEGFYNKFTIALRSFSSLEDIKKKTFDADAFIRNCLGVSEP